MPPPSLDDDFLDRVRRSYRLGIVLGERAGYIWQLIDERRADVHAALMSATNDGLRRVFANPATTDLFYGIDELCRSRPPQQIDGSIVDHLLANHRGTLAAYQVHSRFLGWDLFRKKTEQNQSRILVMVPRSGVNLS